MVFTLNQILNVSPNLQIAIYLEIWYGLPNFFSMMLKSMSVPLTVPNRSSNGGLDLSSQSFQFYSYIQFEIRNNLACWFCWTVKPQVWQCLKFIH